MASVWRYATAIQFLYRFMGTIASTILFSEHLKSYDKFEKIVNRYTLQEHRAGIAQQLCTDLAEIPIVIEENVQ